MLLFGLLFASTLVYGQYSIEGQVVSSSSGAPIEGAIVRAGQQGKSVFTNENGVFKLVLDEIASSFDVSYLGFETNTVSAPFASFINIALDSLSNELEEVVISSGYQKIPKERVTGSFSFIDSSLLNRKFTPDLLGRLEGVTSALAFDRRSNQDNDGRASLRLRGIGTMYANSQPLIVLDNFPYEGDIANLNPNDVLSVTVLRDAAAASIWGVRAANGVVVITTRQGHASETVSIGLTSNVAISPRPDFSYDQGFLEASEFLDIEEFLFSRGLYDNQLQSIIKQPVTPYVEYLNRHRVGAIDAEKLSMIRKDFEVADIRDDASKYLYRNTLNQLTALTIDGGINALRYYFSAGYGINNTQLLGTGDHRFTINTFGTYKLSKNLELQSRIFLTMSDNKDNGIDFRSLSDKLYPYARLKDNIGQNDVIVREYSEEYKAEQENLGLVDWRYRPLDELALSDQTSRSTDIIWNTTLSYRLSSSLSIDARYQFARDLTRNRLLNHEDSYYVRSMLNRYTQPDGVSVFPMGAVFGESFGSSETHEFRPTLNVNTYFGQNNIHAIAGVEIKQNMLESSHMTRYGFDPDNLIAQGNLNFNEQYQVRPLGTALLPAPANNSRETIDRYLSYFSNVAYSLKGRYVASGSARWDVSNLFGVNTNQRGVPLWSIGGSWLLSEEPFYSLSWIPYLRIRTTYGINGNLDKSVTAFPTARFANDGQTGLLTAQVTNPGNPSLRWERVKTANLALDFHTKNKRIAGSIEYYKKNSKDLFGYSFIDPTVFFSGSAGGSYMINYASMTGRGLDFELNSINIQTNQWQWKSFFFLNYNTNRVTEYLDDARGSLDAFLFGRFTRPIKGLPMDIIFSYPWKGLDGETGDPLVIVDGELGKAYARYRQGLKLDDLVYHGSSVPLIFGAFRHTFDFSGWSIGFNLQYKFKYFFRRSSINYYSFLTSNIAHQDHKLRWRQPGDEHFTQVPALPEQIDGHRDLVYNYSELLVEPGDHIRLKDIVFSYNIPLPRYLSVRDLRIYGNVSNLGILWKKSGSGIDPDYPLSIFPPLRSYSLGFSLNF